MFLLRRKKPLSKRIQEAQARAAHLRTGDLYDWAEQAQYVYGKCVNDARAATPEQAGNMLEEAVLAGEVCRVIAEELQSRSIR